MRNQVNTGNSSWPSLIKYLIGSLFVGVLAVSVYSLITNPSTPTGRLIFLVSLSSFCLLVIFLADQIDWLDLKNLKIKLRQVEEARADVEERENRVREIAALMGELLTYIGATVIHASGVPENDEWIGIKLSMLENLAGKKIDNPYTRFSNRLALRDADADKHDKELNNIWADLREDVKRDIERLKTHQ